MNFVEIGPNKGDDSEFFYSRFTEWGTSKQPAQHWAENSVLENKRKINEIITDEYDTEGEKPKAQSAKLKGKFYPTEKNGNYRFIVDEDAQGLDATIIRGWFTAIP